MKRWSVVKKVLVILSIIIVLFSLINIIWVVYVVGTIKDEVSSNEELSEIIYLKSGDVDVSNVPYDTPIEIPNDVYSSYWKHDVIDIKNYTFYTIEAEVTANAYDNIKNSLLYVSNNGKVHDLIYTLQYFEEEGNIKRFYVVIEEDFVIEVLYNIETEKFELYNSKYTGRQVKELEISKISDVVIEEYNIENMRLYIQDKSVFDNINTQVKSLTKDAVSVRLYEKVLENSDYTQITFYIIVDNSRVLEVIYNTVENSSEVKESDYDFKGLVLMFYDRK